MKYELIKDREKLEEFVDWLPDLETNEKYFLAMFARKKYVNFINSSDKSQLKRITSNKKDIVSKIEQMECPVGAFKTKEGIPIPTEALVLYIMPNPRDMVKASFLLIKEMLKAIENSNKFVTPHAEALSCIQRCKSKTHFVHFDIDAGTSADVYDVVNPIIGDSFRIVQTRGGCHLLVTVKDVKADGNWYGKIVSALSDFGVDQTGDLMVPIPGCTQGNFTPHFFKNKKTI
jgi:hypothetical protein